MKTVTKTKTTKNLDCEQSLLCLKIRGEERKGASVSASVTSPPRVTLADMLTRSLVESSSSRIFAQETARSILELQ